MFQIESIIDDLHLEDLQNEKHPSIFDINEMYDMLIIRLPVISKVFNIHSIGFIITPDASYIYHKNTQSFEQLEEHFEGIHRLLDKKVDALLKSFSSVQDTIGDMEESLYSNEHQKNFMSSWLLLKRDILRVERILLRTATVLEDFIDHYKEYEVFPINHFIDLHEHIERTMRSATLQLTKLDYLYNFHSALTNEKMNRLIYVLTIISGIFLPLNLLVGFFGMNTTDLPFAKESGGTLYAVFLMITLFVATSGMMYLWKIRYLK